MIGKNILHYKIISELGAGGMGVVYKAEDTKLDRTVALKFLPAHIAADKTSKERFLIEAKAAAGLSHTNIATIYTIEESQSESARIEELFIVMEFVEGQNLKQKMETDPFTISESIAFAKQVAEGLLAAHKKGITHRDIKPPNIMVTPEGKAKIMDFGLAKLAEGSVLTREGSTPGTAAYMSPEQASGEKVDQRTDIWSFGVVLYEMLCGQRPFKGDYEQAVIYSILNTDPESITERQSSLPEGIDELFHKLFQKKAENRVRTFKEVITDLDKLREGEPITARPVKPLTGSGQQKDQSGASTHLTVSIQKTFRKRTIFMAAALIAVMVAGYTWLLPLMFVGDEAHSIAILPFVNNSKEGDTDYLSEGIPESIIKSLQQIPRLTVTSFNYVLQKYKNETPDISTVGEELDVRTVVSGRMSLRGEELAISIEVINTGDRSVVYSNNYTQQMAALANIKSIIARDITENLRVQVSSELVQKVFTIDNENPEAYRNYLIGRYYMNKRTETELNLAIDYFEKAVAIDLGYALAYSGISDSYMMLIEKTSLPDSIGFQKAKPAVEKALRLAPELAETHASMGQYLLSKKKFKEAETELRIAIELNPEYANAYRWLGANLLNLGDNEGALNVAKKVFELEPSIIGQAGNLATAYFWAGKMDAGIQYFNEIVVKYPSRAEAYIGLSYLYFLNNDIGKALIELEKATELDHDNTFAFLTRCVVLLVNREYKKLETHISTLLRFDDIRVVSLLITAYYYQIKDYQKYTGRVHSLLSAGFFPDAENMYNTSFGSGEFTEANFKEYNQKLIDTMEQYGLSDAISPDLKMFLYHAAGDKTKTMAMLKLINQSSLLDRMGLLHVVRFELFDDYHSEPEFIEILRDLGYEK